MSRWMTTRELASELRYSGKHPLISVYKFIKRTGVKTTRRGPTGMRLIDRADVQRVIAVQRGKAA